MRHRRRGDWRRHGRGRRRALRLVLSGAVTSVLCSCVGSGVRARRRRAGLGRRRRGRCRRRGGRRRGSGSGLRLGSALRRGAASAPAPGVAGVGAAGRRRCGRDDTAGSGDGAEGAAPAPPCPARLGGHALRTSAGAARNADDGALLLRRDGSSGGEARWGSFTGALEQASAAPMRTRAPANASAAASARTIIDLMFRPPVPKTLPRDVSAGDGGN